MNIRVSIKIIQFVFVLVLMFTTVCFAATTLYVGGDGVNVRKGPGSDNLVVTRLYRGQEVIELSRDKDWVEVKVPADGTVGWVHESLLQDYKSYFVRFDNVNVRSGPGKEYDVIAKIGKHSEVAEKSKQGDWVQIDILDTGDTGWVHNSLLYESRIETDKEAGADDTAAGPDSPLRVKSFSQGTRTLADGTKYIGQFKNGVFNGQGTLIYPDGRVYKGEFKDGLFDGEGEMKLNTGGGYKGEWKKGMFHGQGTMTRYDGSKFKGLWEYNRWTGQGIYISPEGNTYEGEWKDGMFDGKGVMVYKDGTVKKGIWKKGKLVEEIKE